MYPKKTKNLKILATTCQLMYTLFVRDNKIIYRCTTADQSQFLVMEGVAGKSWIEIVLVTEDRIKLFLKK